MEQLPNYGDIRQMAFCIYCGRGTETRDHVPPRVFLDEPYPTNLPVVPACQPCNQGLSKDEEYVACLVECATVGSVQGNDIKREKVKRVLQRKPALASRLSQSLMVMDDGVSFDIETDRVKNVILKLAQGHAAFELNEPQRDEPSSVVFSPLVSMTPEAREDFETPPCSPVWPEVGSRASQRLIVADPGAAVWVVAQPERYRYLTSVSGGVIVRMVIGEHLGCEVTWA